MSRLPGGHRRRTFGRRRRRVTLVSRLERLRPPAELAPLTAITPPSATATASERTGSHLGVRLTVSAAIVVILFSVLVVRLWSLQVLQGSQFNQAAYAGTSVTNELLPPRGDILARDGQVLAGVVAQEQVVLNPDIAAQYKGVIARLADLLQVSAAAINTAIAQSALQFGPHTPVVVPTGPGGVTPDDVLYIDGNTDRFPGVTVSDGYVRTYPEKQLAAQTIGYVGDISSKELPSYTKYGYTAQDQIGQSGLESQYELYLHGTPGKVVEAIDPLGNIIGERDRVDPVPGDNVVLNMDLGLEQALSQALSTQIENLRAGTAGATYAPAPWGAAVVLDPNTGAVLAMVSNPSYNDNIWTGGISIPAYKSLSTAPGLPLNNYAISSLEPPGSTFKLATATAALDDGLISAGTYIDDPGSYTLGNQVYRDTAESSGAGELDVSSALTVSNDIFFYKLGADFWFAQHSYGVDAIQKVANAYGLGEQTGIDLPGQATGQIDSPQLRIAQHREYPKIFPYEQYQPGDNVDMAFGQGESVVNPIEVATAYATFANGGTRYAPELAGEVVSPTGKVVQRIAPKVTGHVALPASTYEPMLAGFQGVVQDSSGTAYGAFTGFDFSKWNLYGKTGTATVSVNDVIPPTSWFVGFGGPKGEKTQYVVAVEINEGGYGATASAPVARAAFNYLLAHPASASLHP